MTTAHRATYHNALGGDNQGGNILVAKTSKVCARDLPGFTTLKTRATQPAPLYEGAADSAAPLSKDVLKSLLESKEHENRESRLKALLMEGPAEAAPMLNVAATLADLKAAEASGTRGKLTPYVGDSDDDDAGALGQQGPSGSVGQRKRPAADANDSDASQSGDEEEELLMRELEQIKQEREREQREREMQLQKEAELEQQERALAANPLLLDTTGDDGDGLKRRWDEDVVFRNQAKDLKKLKKRFINDTVRSDFHRRFLARYVH